MDFRGIKNLHFTFFTNFYILLFLHGSLRCFSFRVVLIRWFLPHGYYQGYDGYMDAKKVSLQFKRNSVVEIVDRFIKNASEKKFSLSKPNSRIVFELNSAKKYFDGKNGDLIVEFPVKERHIADEILKNPEFFAQQHDLTQVTSLTEIQDEQERSLYGKPAREMDIPELFNTFPHILQDIFATATPSQKS